VFISGPVQTGPEAHPAPCTRGTGSFLEGKRLGNGAEVKEIVELYFFV
jgi:hypothetical protein